MIYHRPYFLKELIILPLKVISATLLLIFLCQPPGRADDVITRGVHLKINSGVFVTTLRNVVIENGGTVNVEGTLILKNNFTNQNTAEDLGKGTLEFSGTSLQNISGQNTLGKLVVNNPAGLNLMGNTMVNNELGLLNGKIRLGTSNLTLGSILSGTPSASAMVVTTGTGELRKRFSGIGSFTFPIGDEVGTGKYTPVTLNFTQGSFSPGNYTGVTLKPTAYPGYTGNGLNRYWSLTQNGISAFTYDAIFRYVPSDYNGDENELLCIRIEPKLLVPYNPSNSILHQLTANGLNSFGNFTGISSRELKGIDTHALTDIRSNGETSEFKCFPNPFTRGITIEVQNSTKTEITVGIYNMTGQLIKKMYKGIHQKNLVLKWDGENESGGKVAPGAYLCKVNGMARLIIYEGEGFND